jgi:hypothetical protein
MLTGFDPKPETSAYDDLRLVEEGDGRSEVSAESLRRWAGFLGVGGGFFPDIGN